MPVLVFAFRLLQRLEAGPRRGQFGLQVLPAHARRFLGSVRRGWLVVADLVGQGLQVRPLAKLLLGQVDREVVLREEGIGGEVLGVGLDFFGH